MMRFMKSPRSINGLLTSLPVIVEMEETSERRQTLTVDLLKEAKRIEFPDNVIAELDW